MQTCRTTRKIFSSSIRKLCKTQVKFQIQRNIQAKLLRSLATFGSANTYWKCSITNLNDEHRCVKSTFCFVGLKQHQRSAMGGEQQQSFLVEREKQRTLCTKHSSCSTLVVRNDSIMVYRCILYMLFIAHTHTWLGILPRLHDNDNSNWNHDDERNNKNVLKNKVTSTLLALAYVIRHCWSSLGTFRYYSSKLVFLLITFIILACIGWCKVIESGRDDVQNRRPSFTL